MENSTRWKNTSNMLENMYDLTTYPELCNPENRGYHKLLESYISNLDPEVTRPVSHHFAKPVWYCYITNMPLRAKRVRESRGLTIKQVSEATGIPQSTISQYENGKRKPKREVLEKLSDYYGVDQKILIYRGNKNGRD